MAGDGRQDSVTTGCFLVPEFQWLPRGVELEGLGCATWIELGWLVRTPTRGPPLRTEFLRAGVSSELVAFLTAHLASYGAWILPWLAVAETHWKAAWIPDCAHSTIKNLHASHRSLGATFVAMATEYRPLHIFSPQKFRSAEPALANHANRQKRVRIEACLLSPN